MTDFVVETFQNEFLPVGGTEIDAIVTVTANLTSPVRTATTPLGHAVVIIIDTSGSMSQPRSKLRAARKAASVAVEGLRDGTWFAVVSGSDRTRYVYPDIGMASATMASKAEATAAIGQVRPGGGTLMSTWLMAARHLLLPYEGWIRQAILLTDGQNHDPPNDIGWVLEQCDGIFRCDSRGVGTDWSVADLRQISTALLGTFDIVADPSGLAADFDDIVSRTMGQHATDVRLRVSVPPGTTRRFVKQVAPAIEDLTARGAVVDERTIDYPLGAWGNEERDYHVGLSVIAQQPGDDMLAARVSVEVGNERVAQSIIKATWTDDPATSTIINPRVAHYTGQAELASAIESGLVARRNGDDATATRQLGRAVQLAEQSGHGDTLALLRGVVDIDDPASGTVRLKRTVDTADEMALDTRSTKTVRVKSSR